MNRVLVGSGVAVIVVAGTLGGMRLMGFGHGNGSQEVQVTLAPQGGVCQPSDPSLLGGAFADKVTWIVQNNCSEAQYFATQDFTNKSSGAAGKDIVKPEGPLWGESIPMRDTRSLPAKINKWNWFSSDRYKYRICIGTTAGNLRTCSLDPDIEIWGYF